MIRSTPSLLCRLPFVLLAILLGCDNSLSTVPVHGVVTFDGKTPPKPGTLYFSPNEVEEGMSNRPAFASFDKAGRFEVQSIRPGDGIVPGVYSVRVDCWKVEPVPDKPGVSYVSEDFVAENLVVSSGTGRVEHNVDVVLKP